MELEQRAAAHAALGDARRLSIVEALGPGDLTVAELAGLTALPGNLLAHHLDVLDGAGLIARRASEGDRRRRYVSLRWDNLPATPQPAVGPPGTVVFVCTANSARSQFAAALYRERLGGEATSAGSHPAERVHPLAVEVATGFGIDLSGAVPGGYERIPGRPGLLVSVCDRVRESGVPGALRTLHWSIPDPVPAADRRAFRAAFADIDARIARLTAASPQKGP